MHWNKGTTSIALDRLNGSRGFSAAARTVIAVGDNPGDDGSKVILLVKASLGRSDMPALRYRIEGRLVDVDGQSIPTSGVAWCGEATGVSVADLFSQPNTEEERSALTEAVEWLSDFLSDGDQQSKDVKAEARKAGIKDATLRRAQTRLGIKPRKEGKDGPWVWSLPLEGAQPLRRENLEHLEHLQPDQHFSASEDAQISEGAHVSKLSTFRAGARSETTLTATPSVTVEPSPKPAPPSLVALARPSESVSFRPPVAAARAATKDAHKWCPTCRGAGLDANGVDLCRARPPS
jgi:hypothetical protein